MDHASGTVNGRCLIVRIRKQRHQVAMMKLVPSFSYILNGPVRVSHMFIKHSVQFSAQGHPKHIEKRAGPSCKNGYLGISQ